MTPTRYDMTAECPNCGKCTVVPDADANGEWVKFEDSEAAVAAAVATVVEQRRELKFKVFQQQLQLTEAFDTEKQLRAERDTLRGLLIRVTGSLGLICSGADPKAPGHAQNYEDARTVLESGQDATVQHSAVKERDEEIRRLRKDKARLDWLDMNWWDPVKGRFVACGRDEKLRVAIDRACAALQPQTKEGRK